MSKIEFLNILRQALDGEVSAEVIEQNIQYYDTYIESKSMEEEAQTISELGNPRLLAKTIIEADKAAKEKSRGGWSQGNTQDYQSNAEYSEQEEAPKFGRTFSFSNLKWYHKIIVALVAIILLVLIVLIGRLIIGFLFAFGLPLILILLIMTLFRRR